MRWILMSVALLVAGAGVAQADDPITPEEAVKMKGEKVSVVMVVKSTKLQRGLAFLNSEEDFKNESNFTIFIGNSAMKKFEEADIKDPSTHYKDKKVIVTGTVMLYRGQGQIAVTGPDDIKIEEKK